MTLAELKYLWHHSEISGRRFSLAVLTGTAALGSAVGLSAISAWLIARAAGMPSPADLALASVVVRFFGISRGIFRYLERLISHDTALRATANFRAHTYERIAANGGNSTLKLPRGEVMARLGNDVDALGDALVRALIPLAVAVLVSGIAFGINLFLLPTAGAVLGICLAAAAIIPALLTWKGAQIAGAERATAEAAVSAAALSAIEGAPEHIIWGRTLVADNELSAANANLEKVEQKQAQLAATASATQTLFAGLALIGCLYLAVTAGYADTLGPTTLTMVALVPLAAFEAVGVVPTAVTQLFRSVSAVRRLAQLSEPDETRFGAATSHEGKSDEVRAVPQPKGGVTLIATNLSAAWPGMAPTRPVSFTAKPGSVWAVIGASGIGKTTLMLTLAGALPPVRGTVDLEPEVPERLLPIAYTPEDAHIFGTTILENLRVARADISAAAALETLSLVGLSEWVKELPQGLDTPLGTLGNSLSGGQRRRLLLARALLSPAPINLIDEGAEHLDMTGLEALANTVSHFREHQRTIVLVTHDLRTLDLVDEVIDLDG